MKKTAKDTLIALLKYRRDLDILFEQRWYRIPVKSAPLMVRNNEIRYLALYQPRCFNEDAFKIQYYGEIRNISIMKRRELFPDEATHQRAEENYYRIDLAEVLKRTEPIFSRRKRIVIFITTTLQKLQSATELNDIFLESPIEEIFWEKLKSENIDAERQFAPESFKNKIHLDFALFSRERSIAIECDGDTYHTAKEDVKKDKRRANQLESQGWAMLRYTTEDINQRLDDCLHQVKETINTYGGLQDTVDLLHYRYLDTGQSQLLLFDQ